MRGPVESPRTPGQSPVTMTRTPRYRIQQWQCATLSDTTASIRFDPLVIMVTAAQAPTTAYIPRGCSFHTRGPASATDRIVAGRSCRRFLTPAKCRKDIAHRAMSFTNGICSARARRRSPSVWFSCSRTRSSHVATPFQDQKHTPLRVHSSHFATCNLTLARCLRANQVPSNGKLSRSKGVSPRKSTLSTA